MDRDDTDDSIALRAALRFGLDARSPVNIEFVVDVLERDQVADVVRRLEQVGAAFDVWDDPNDGSLSVYVSKSVRPTLQEIIVARDTIRAWLSGLHVSVEDWGVAIAR